MAASHRALLALNEAMLGVSDGARPAFTERMLAATPVVLALFSGEGGRMILHQPGRSSSEAPAVPVTYQYLKAAGHSTVAIFKIMTRYGKGDRATLREDLLTYAEMNRHALDHLPKLTLEPGDLEMVGAVLGHNRDFLDRALSMEHAEGEYLSDFARGTVPFVLTLLDRAATVQVTHWTTVIEKWKADLGDAWEHTLAAVNTLYVTRQKNILYTILAQAMGEAAIGDRLLLFETPEFTTTPEQMLDLLARIIADRELGATFFGEGRVMDVEILGDSARRAIRAQAARRGATPLLPTTAPYDSHQWPWPTDPHNGTATSTLRATTRTEA
ncbi:hypothetical protein ACIRP0_22850 [Streptomyces sp. NPDC101733]|uniref:hypothetical protein n=1 Tax=unclassified Streptomyces TaxID=2593676 RepID=UPI00382EC6E6